MEKKYKILQIGPEDWRDTLALPAQLDWYHVPPNTPSAIQKIMDEKKFGSLSCCHSHGWGLI